MLKDGVSKDKIVRVPREKVKAALIRFSQRIQKGIQEAKRAREIPLHVIE